MILIHNLAHLTSSTHSSCRLNMASEDRHPRTPERRTSALGAPESEEKERMSARRVSKRKSVHFADELEQGRGEDTLDVEMTDASANNSNIEGANSSSKGVLTNKQPAQDNLDEQKRPSNGESPAKPLDEKLEMKPGKEVELEAWTRFGSNIKLTNAQANMLVQEGIEKAREARRDEIEGPEDIVEDEELQRRFMEGEPRDYRFKEREKDKD